jgi:hypothetical protein
MDNVGKKGWSSMGNDSRTTSEQAKLRRPDKLFLQAKVANNQTHGKVKPET